MPKPELNVLTLLAVLIAGALVGRALPGPWTTTLTGLLLLVILFAYEDNARERTFWQSVAFAGVCGFCSLLCFGAILSRVTSQPQAGGWNFYTPYSSTHSESPTTVYLPSLIWLAGTILFLLIDRARRQGTPAPVYQRRPQAEPATPTTAPEPAFDNHPTPPNAIALPVGAGKPATIYLNLLNEGLACLRPVQAEQMGKDYYRIVENVPEGEAWEYQPGQIVRCQKKNLSSGKALVAVEEAPRAR